MMILNNEEVSTLLSMDNCLRHLEAAYKELSDGTAVNRPRSDLYLPATSPSSSREVSLNFFHHFLPRNLFVF